MSYLDNVQVGREAIGATAAKITLNVGGIVGTVIFARVLGATSFGGFALLLTLSTFADRPMYGWAEANKKRFSESGKKLSEYVGSVTIFNLFWAVIVGTVVMIFSHSIESYTGVDNSGILLLFLILSLSFFSSLTPLLEAQGLVSVSNWISTLRSYITLPIQIGLVITGFGVVGMLFGSIIGAALVIPVTVYYIGALPALPTLKRISACVDYARYSIPAITLRTITKRLDILILGLLLTPTAAGYYEVAWRFTVPTMFLSQASGAVIMAKISANNEDDDAISEEIKKALSFVSLIAIPVFFGSIVVGNNIIVATFGKEYMDATPLLVGLAIYCIIQSQTTPLIEAVNGFDRPDIDMRLSILSFVVNVVLGVWLVYTIGPIGVVIGTVVAELVRYFLVSIFLHRRVGIANIYSRSVVKQLIAGCIMSVFLFVVVNSFHIGFSAVNVYATTMLGGVVYFSILAILHPKRFTDIRNQMIL